MNGSPGTRDLLFCGRVTSPVTGHGDVLVGPPVVIGQRPGPPVEHEPPFQPLASALTAGSGQLFQVAAARRAVDPEVSVVRGGPVGVQLVSRGLDVRSQVEQRRLVAGRPVSVVSDRQVSGEWSL